MIINYHEFKSPNFNSHKWVKNTKDFLYKNIINEDRFFYDCKICHISFFNLTDLIVIHNFYNDNIICTFDQCDWDIFEKDILSCNEFLIKNIIE